MFKYIVAGGKKLEGVVEASGSKNAALPILAATILTGGTSTLYNGPKIRDIEITIKILKLLGCKVIVKSDKIIINSEDIKQFNIPEELMRQMRSSVILAGAILGRFKKTTFSYPGGCDIGARPIELHLKGLKKLNIEVNENGGNIECKCDKIIGNKIHLDFPSVGATENIIMASVLAEGETVITNAAMEPEIIDLQNFLNRAGAKIKGAGTNTIIISGVKELKKEVKYNIMSDRIETGTLLCAAAITGGNIEVRKTNPEYIFSTLQKLEETGCKIFVQKNSINIEAPKKLKPVEIKTLPYPGFATDMQSILVATLTTAKGTSVMVENIFENRYKYVNQLKKLGANIQVEGNIAIIKGVRKLHGANVESTDLRGGAALCIAGLAAKGKTEISNINYILRGYENLDKKLNSLGALITKEKIEG